MAKRSLQIANNFGDDTETSSPMAQGPHKMARISKGALTPRRRITSCAACRKQKIKCELLSDEPPCERCRRKGIECIINTGLRNSILDQRQLSALRRDLGHLHSALDRVCHHLSIDAPPALETPSSLGDSAVSQLINDSADYDDASLYQSSPQHSPTAVHAPMDAYLVPRRSPDTSPANPLSQATGFHSQSSSQLLSKPRGRHGKRPPDLVSKGLITFEEADTLVQSYLTLLDPILYGLAGDLATTQSVRDASPALLAVMCTVASLNNIDNERLYHICYQEFRNLVMMALFEKRDVEHIRALAIGTFWLPDASRILLGDAVRRAADTRIYRQITRVLKNMSTASSDSEPVPADALDRVRLWYALFICDQHLSVLHNRDRLMPRRKDVLDARKTFLTVTGRNMRDTRLVSQVSILLIMSRIKDAFGSEYPTPVSVTQSSQIEQFTKEIDSWYSCTCTIYEKKLSPEDLVLTGFPMHHHFAKLYLGQHVLRGLQPDHAIPGPLLAAATMAYDSSVRIFELIDQHNGLCSKLGSVPTYVLVMVSFAGHLLLEMCLKHRQQLRINVESDYRLINSVVDSIRAMRTAQQHPLRRVAESLSKRLAEFAAAYGQELLTDSASTPSEATKRMTAQLDIPVDGVQDQSQCVFDLDSTMMLDSLSFTDFGSFNFGVPFPDLTMT
ncbi:hypothetical protein CDD81_318 [Ophiocordyceps australis]|uniref:Zn(2)-C6 fungal-type domain-containing protein n=1 Tax=Ophiocordyceps australis TaxID=1399860 RepID=A0A2C5Y3K5_9HYPO|nr:hypothetical protein CDD81_318 [Ophiocordyceps australis]